MTRDATDPGPTLRDLPGFDLLSRAEAEIFDRRAESLWLDAGETVEPGAALLVVASGTLDLTVPSPGGSSRLGTEVQGGIVGEAGLFVPDAVPIAVGSAGGATCYRFGFHSLRRGFHYSRPCAAKLEFLCARSLARKVRGANRLLLERPAAAGRSSLEKPPRPQALDARDLRVLSALATVEERAAGEVVFHEGDKAGGLYALADGEVEIVRADGRGSETALARIGPGEFFGEMAFVDDEPRSATARVRSRARLLVLPAGTLERLLDADLRSALYVTNVICKMVARRLAATLQRVTAA